MKRLVQVLLLVRGGDPSPDAGSGRKTRLVSQISLGPCDLGNSSTLSELLFLPEQGKRGLPPFQGGRED